MNNIEILEDLLQQRYDEKLLNNISMINEKDEVYVLTIFERQAIENLIKENKELKEALRSEIQAFNKMKELAETIRKENVEYIIQNRQYELHYIPKSKVKEKIEELEKERKRKDEEDTINPFYDQIDITHIIEVLQELLEGE